MKPSPDLLRQRLVTLTPSPRDRMGLQQLATYLQDTFLPYYAGCFSWAPATSLEARGATLFVIGAIDHDDWCWLNGAAHLWLHQHGYLNQRHKEVKRAQSPG